MKVELPPEPLINPVKKEWLGYLNNSIVFLALGIGFILMALVFNVNVQELEEARIIFYGIGIVLSVVGLGLLIYSLILKRYEKE